MDKANGILKNLNNFAIPNLVEPTNTDLIFVVIQWVCLYVHVMLQGGQITERICSYLTTEIDRTILLFFYILPAIHKNLENSPGRPIVWGSGCPTKKISKFVDHIIGPLVPLTRSDIRTPPTTSPLNITLRNSNLKQLYAQ